jgi:hypothetical protein
MSASTPTWIWDTTHSLYYSPESGTYAYTDPSGGWHYLPASSLASSSTPAVATNKGEAEADKEDGEIEDDVGWGGLMEPEELDRALKSKTKVKVGSSSNPSSRTDTTLYEKHPAYANLYSRTASPSPPAETPNHLLRLVVLSSPSLPEGHVAIIDTREGGIQLGRDRCEKGGHPRVRVKEMEVSKSHAVIYWGKGENEVEGWWVVDLGTSHHRIYGWLKADYTGSTHGTFVGEPGEPRTGSRHRLSTPKSSSLPYPLAHLSTLTLGQTIFEIHQHPQWPCDECQLGRANEIPIDTGEPLVQNPKSQTQEGGNGYAMNSSEKRENREVKRKREMAALKDSLLNRHPAGEAGGDKREYIDRSAIRRKLHPKSPPRASTTLSEPVVPPPKAPGGVSTFAQNIMVAQGWAPGSGLGKDRDGRSEAVEVKMRVEKRGLGAQGAEKPIEEGGEGDWRKKGRSRRFEEVREW